MTIITSDCPHCRAQNMTFTVFGLYSNDSLQFGDFATVLVAASCRSCALPIVVRIGAPSNDWKSNSLRFALEQHSATGRTFDDFGMRVAEWPKAEEKLLPAGLPPQVAKAFSQAESNYTAPDCEEAAAMMYRRSMELALNISHPALTGSLASRIRSLVTSNALPAPIGDWLDQVRLIGNDGAHEADGVSREDLEAARGFVDTALRYLFTLPAQIAARRKS